jgi:hypothetical protein
VFKIKNVKLVNVLHRWQSRILLKLCRRCFELWCQT